MEFWDHVNAVFLKIFYLMVLAPTDGPCLYQLLHWGLQSDGFPIILFLYFLAMKCYFLVTQGTHGFKNTHTHNVLPFSVLSSLFLLMLKLSQIWLWEPIQASFYALLGTLLLSGIVRCSGITLCISLHNSGIRPLFRVLVPSKENWYLETKIWVLGVLINAGTCHCF